MDPPVLANLIRPFSLATIVLAVTLIPAPALAQARDIEQVRAATVRLINALVEQGVLTRSRADALLREFEAAPPAAPPAAAGAEAPPAGATTVPVPAVRVPFVPEFIRSELKEELRNELAAQAIREGWAGPGAVPAWTRGLRIDGDLRARYQYDNFDPDNGPAVSVTETNRTRAISLLNTTEDRHRLRVRARLGATVTADANWSGGIRLTTGSASDPLSSNQTLGTYGNRFSVLIDRAFVRYRWEDQFNAVVGRFGNPWFSTDLVWANDLSFDGVALQWTPSIGRWRGFATAGAMPIQEFELTTADKWLFGLQLGVDSPSDGLVRGRAGLAVYDYRNIVGRLNAPGSSLNDFTAPAFAQKGNTYFNISSDPTRPLLALASDYRIVNLTGSIDVEAIAGKRLQLGLDFARNLAFDRAQVAQRVGQDVEPKVDAYGLRIAFGDADVNRRGAWQTFFAFKQVGRDAVLDAFTDSDLRLGGTDARGYSVGVTYGLGRNTSATVRWLSGESLSGAPLSVDVLQADLAVRF